MKAVPGWLIQTGAPFAEIIGAAIDSDGSNWRRNQTRAMPAWIGGTCDMASATGGPDRQQMNGLKARLGPLVPVRRLMPTNALSSRILGVIFVASACRNMAGPGHPRPSVTTLTILPRLP